MIQLDLDVGDAGKRGTTGQKADKSCSADQRVLTENETSAVSVSSEPGPAGIDKVPILPSELPVLNNKVDAPAGSTKAAKTIAVMVFCMMVPPTASIPIRSVKNCRTLNDRSQGDHGCQEV